MWDLNYDSVKDIINILEIEGLSMNKKFGQNFLIDHYARESIRELIDIKENEVAFEIGPGLGSITSLILKSGAYVHAFEIDNGFCHILKDKAFFDEDRFILHQGDALKTLFEESIKPDIICGNLPYNVGSVIIAKLIENRMLPKRMVFTLQKEVVMRICASEKSDEYSSFSNLCQLDYIPTLSFVIKKGCFYPEPQVESAVVVLKKREKSLVDDDLREIFITLNRDLFAKRRKTIRNNLKSSKLNINNLDIALEENNLTGSERAEELSLSRIISLAKSISNSSSF